MTICLIDYLAEVLQKLGCGGAFLFKGKIILLVQIINILICIDRNIKLKSLKIIKDEIISRLIE